MKQKDIKNLTEDDLMENLAQQENALSKLRMNHAVSPLENPKQITETKRTVARLKTEKRKRELNSQSK